MDSTGQAAVGKLARPSGALAIVAIDQRESLRSMFKDARGVDVSDEVLVDFKEAVAETLAPHASAMLFDRHFGMPAFEKAASIAPECGRIMAADALTQPPGGPVESTDVDEAVSPHIVYQQGAVGLKLLLIWHGDATRSRNMDVAHRFMDRCRSAGLAGIVEAIVKPGAGSAHEKLLLDAAFNLATVQPDLYKCQVPFHGKAHDSEIVEVCEQITATATSPWVVLSQGVPTEEFPRSVELACKGGASGFLAGRAIWSDTIRAENIREQLRSVSVGRLKNLVEIVDEYARPWQAVAPNVEGPSAKTP